MIVFTDKSVRTQSPEELDLVSKVKVLFAGVKVPRPENHQKPTDFGLPFNTHRYQNFTGETLEAWYVPAQSEDVIVMLFHGYAESKESLLPVATELYKLGFGVLSHRICQL